MGKLNIKMKCERCSGTDVYCSSSGKYGLAVCQDCDHEMIPPGYCQECAGKLVPIGDARENGAWHSDWPSRQYHKKCWREYYA